MLKRVFTEAETPDPILFTIELAPFDDVQSALLGLVASAQRTIDIEIYGFALPALTQALLARHAAGVRVRILFDHTQACGPAERDQVAQLRAAGVECWIGTSPQRQIRHSKVMIVDGLTVEMGSYNYSATAARQNNTYEEWRDAKLAALFTADWEAGKAWISANEPQYNQPAGTETTTP